MTLEEALRAAHEIPWCDDCCLKGAYQCGLTINGGGKDCRRAAAFREAFKIEAARKERIATEELYKHLWRGAQ